MRRAFFLATALTLAVSFASPFDNRLAAADTGGEIPRAADGKPDLSGIWQTLGALDYDLEPHGTRRDAPPGLGIVDGGTIPYQPRALEERRKRFEARATADPRTRCFTLGTPRAIYGGGNRSRSSSAPAI